MPERDYKAKTLMTITCSAWLQSLVQNTPQVAICIALSLLEKKLQFKGPTEVGTVPQKLYL